MTRKPLNQSEFLSALDFVKTDIDNLRAYFEQGAIQPTTAVLERALKLRVSIEMFVALFGSATARDLSFSSVLDELAMQNKALSKQNEQVLAEFSKANTPISATILNEILNVKEMLASKAQKTDSESAIAQLRTELSASLSDLEQRIIKNIEYSTKSQLQEYSSRVIQELNHQRQNPRGGMHGELAREIAEFREECEKQITQVEKSILDSIESSKDEIIYSQKSDEIIKIVKDSKVDVEKSLVLAKTNMQVLRAISKQLIGIYQSEKRALAEIQKSIAGTPSTSSFASGEEIELSKGFAELKSELQALQGIINFEELEKMKDPNEAIQMVDSYQNAQFEPEGLLQTAKELEALASELSELERQQKNQENQD